MGIFVSARAISDFAATPKDVPVTEGIYRVSRNPMYVGWSLMYIAIGIATVSRYWYSHCFLELSATDSVVDISSKHFVGY